MQLLPLTQRLFDRRARHEALIFIGRTRTTCPSTSSSRDLLVNPRYDSEGTASPSPPGTATGATSPIPGRWPAADLQHRWLIAHCIATRMSPAVLSIAYSTPP
eukprot:767010-Hanusia_phi.AAC.3